jgi:hypothetical protein
MSRGPLFVPVALDEEDGRLLMLEKRPDRPV